MMHTHGSSVSLRLLLTAIAVGLFAGLASADHHAVGGEAVGGEAVGGDVGGEAGGEAGGDASAPAMMHSGDLLGPDHFASITDDDARARALFIEAAKVILHPRCVNCHPAGDGPLQGDLAAHEPPVTRGPDSEGVVGMQCGTCHTASNFDPGRVPGAPHWHLAPHAAAWEGKTVAHVCQQIKYPERNGNMDLEDIVRHMSEDPLVAWGWNPGAGRAPVPGDQQTFGQLIRAWVDAGAACPE